MARLFCGVTGGIRTATTVVAVALLAGCSISPAYNPPQLGAFSSEGFRAENRLDGQRYATASARWWEDFNDPKLNQLVEQALRNNRSLREALFRLEASRRTIELQRLGRFPTGQIDSSAVRSRTAAAAIITDVPSLGESVEPFDDQVAYGVGSSASWEIDIFGRVNQLVNVARLEAQALDQAYLDLQRVLIGDVVSAYALLQGIERRLSAARNSAALQRETLNTTQALFDEGEVSLIDVRRARARYNQTVTLFYGLEAERDAAQNALATLVGASPARLFGTNSLSFWQDTALPNHLPVTSPVQLIRQRPDIGAAERRLAAETALIGVEVSNYYPRIVLSGSVGLRSASLSNIVSDTAFQYSLGPQISLGIFDFPRVGARVAVQQANVQAALAQFDATVLAALEETETALSRYAIQSDSVTALEAVLIDTEEVRNLARDGYAEGVIDYLQFLNAEQELVDAQTALAAARAERFISLVNVYRAFGGRLTSS